MKKLLILFVLFCALDAAGQRPGSIPNTYLDVNGVRLNTPYATVLKKLGFPLKTPKEEWGGCTPGMVRTVIYPGLTILFYENKPGKFTVGELEVTSARWRVSGVKMGTTGADIHSRFGKSQHDSPETQDREGAIQYDFANEDEPGWTNFYFRKGRLVRVLSSYTVC